MLWMTLPHIALKLPNPEPDPNPIQVSWDTPWPDYAPIHFEAAVLAEHVRGMATGGGWADPAEIDAELQNLISTVRMAFDSPPPAPLPSPSPSS